MRRALPLGLLLLGAGTLLALVPLSRGADDGEAITRSFTFSSDPEVAVLTITHIGGLSGGRNVYILYGDGRLRQELRTRRGDLRESSEAALSYNETRDFLEVAVAHGLLDTSPEELLAELKHPPAIVDAGTMVVEIHVTSYTRNDEEQGPVSNTLRLTAPRTEHAMNPESTPIAGMAALSEHLSRYRERLGQGGSR
jgi:hypothetical protein